MSDLYVINADLSTDDVYLQATQSYHTANHGCTDTPCRVYASVPP
jgi:hypothetical protein